MPKLRQTYIVPRLWKCCGHEDWQDPLTLKDMRCETYRGIILQVDKVASQRANFEFLLPKSNNSDEKQHRQHYCSALIPPIYKLTNHGLNILRHNLVLCLCLHKVAMERQFSLHI